MFLRSTARIRGPSGPEILVHYICQGNLTFSWKEDFILISWSTEVRNKTFPAKSDRRFLLLSDQSMSICEYQWVSMSLNESQIVPENYLEQTWEHSIMVQHQLTQTQYMRQATLMDTYRVFFNVESKVNGQKSIQNLVSDANSVLILLVIVANLILYPNIHSEYIFELLSLFHWGILMSITLKPVQRKSLFLNDLGSFHVFIKAYSSTCWTLPNIILIVLSINAPNS